MTVITMKNSDLLHPKTALKVCLKWKCLCFFNHSIVLISPIHWARQLIKHIIWSYDKFLYEENGQKCEISVRTMYHSHSTVEQRVLGRVFIQLIFSILLLFTKIKIIMKGRFQTAEDIFTNKSDELRAIQQTSIKQCLWKFKRWWNQCIAVQGNYF
jgi:hypothetical protein